MVLAETNHYLDKLFAISDEQIALTYGENSLSYATLKQQALRIAGALAERGIGRNDRVAIALDRGPDLVISLAGVLAAGASYVPLDKSYPPERLLSMIESAAPALVIAESANTFLSDNIACASPDWLYGQHSGLIGPEARRPSDETYVIFTSGSTGRPKGVSMPDGPLANLLRWQSKERRFQEPARTLQFTPASFDVHFQEIFHTLATGGTLVTLSDNARKDPQQLLALTLTQHVERLFMPYVALAALAEAAVATSQFPLALRDVVTAGEQLVITPAIREFFERLPNTRLHNQYGPSETHVVTAFTLKGPASDWPEIPPIGQPIDGVKILVADAELNPVARAAAGELLLAGQCLANGYLTADETTKRFLETNGDRYYRTGDLVRSCGDGLEYLGRTDRQIKIRGHRVEPGEIEAAILADPEVEACAIGTYGDDSASRSLVAYLVTSPASGADLATLTAWEQVWDSTYELPGPAEDPCFDIRGWNSSYGGGPLAAKDMRAWVNEATGRIAALEPKRVLELGAGTGLILYGLDGKFDQYFATDYSRVSVELLNAGIAGVPGLAERTQVRQLAAHNAADMAQEQIDVVVINSLTQHFGSLAYLEQVIEAACNALVGQGKVFVGDVTAQNTRSLYFASVALHEQAACTGEVLLDEVTRSLGQERELVIDPLYFYQLQEKLPQLTDVQIQLKGEGYDNELARFRYDVTLTVGGPERLSLGRCALEAKEWTCWSDAESWAGNLRTGTSGWLRNIPHPRLTELSALLAGASANPAVPLASPPRKAVPPAGATDPVAIATMLPPRPGYRCETFFGEQTGTYDLLLRPDTWAASTTENCFSAHCSGRPLTSFASNPLDAGRFANLQQQLKKRLGERFPDYLIPSRYVPLASLPTTASGKIDRRRLPKPTGQRPL